jgi:hypothetical protein
MLEPSVIVTLPVDISVTLWALVEVLAVIDVTLSVPVIKKTSPFNGRFIIVALARLSPKPVPRLNIFAVPTSTCGSVSVLM